MDEKIVKDSQSLVNDTISRQAVIAALGERPMIWTGSDYELGARNQYDADVLAIETVPSAQPEIIRCRGCCYWIPGLITDNDCFIPPKCGKYQQLVGHFADDYCSYADRGEVSE